MNGTVCCQGHARWRLAPACYRPIMTKGSKKGRRRAQGAKLGEALLGWTRDLLRSRAGFLIVGLGLGLILGVAIAVHRPSAPTQAASQPAAPPPANTPVV